jgi:hypothetical protein
LDVPTVGGQDRERKKPCSLILRGHRRRTVAGN